MVPSIKELRQQLQHTPKHYTTFFGKSMGEKDGIFRPFWDYLVILKYCRFFSIYFTKLFLYTPITANMVTTSTILMGIFSAYLFSLNHYWYGILAAVLLQLINILDCTDGELARYKKHSSHKGDYLDVIQHSTTPIFVFLALPFAVYPMFPYTWVFFLGGLTAASYVLRELYNVLGVYLILKRSELKVPVAMTHQKKTKTIAHSIDHHVGYIFSFYAMSFFFLFAALFDAIYIPFFFYALTFPFVVAMGIYLEFKSNGSKSQMMIDEYMQK